MIEAARFSKVVGLVLLYLGSVLFIVSEGEIDPKSVGLLLMVLGVSTGVGSLELRLHRKGKGQ